MTVKSFISQHDHYLALIETLDGALKEVYSGAYSVTRKAALEGTDVHYDHLEIDNPHWKYPACYDYATACWAQIMHDYLHFFLNIGFSNEEEKHLSDLQEQIMDGLLVVNNESITECLKLHLSNFSRPL